jgi:hypothetical protein
MNLTNRSSNHAMFSTFMHSRALLRLIDSFIGYTSEFYYCKNITALAETKAQLNPGSYCLQSSLCSYSAIAPATTNATKTRRRLPGFAIAAPAVAGAEVCASEEADTGVSVASSVSTTSAFMPRKLYVPDRIHLVDV